MRNIYLVFFLSVMICGLFATGMNDIVIHNNKIDNNGLLTYRMDEKTNTLNARYIVNDIPINNQYLQYFTAPSLRLYKKMRLNIHEHLLGSPDLRGEGPEYKVFDLRTDHDVKSILICGRITTHGRNDFARVVLLGKDEQGVEHLYPIIDTSLIYTPGFTLSGPNVYDFCGIGEETLSLPYRVSPEKLIVEGSNAEVVLDSIYYLPYDEYSKAYLKSSEYYLKEQNNVKIDMINKKNTRFRYKWIAGDTGVSHYPYEIKRKYLGTVSEREEQAKADKAKDISKWYAPLPNTYGIFYYKKGIFSVEPLAMMLDESNKISFSWQNAHGQNWVTSVKNQGSHQTCYAFSATGTHELLINTYFAQHIDKDLSEQQLISNDDGSGVCNPGIYSDVLEDPGQIDEGCFSYTGSSSTPCNPCSDWDTRNWSLTNIPYSNVRVDPKEVFSRLINNGNFDVIIFEWNHGVTGVGAEYYRNENVLAIEFKNSWGTSWGDSGFGKFYSTPGHLRLSSFQPPEHSPSGEPTDIMCYDDDGDGYCWWGTTDTKPSSCPTSCAGNDVKDCDDSDINKHGLINDWICVDNSKHLTSCGAISSPGTYYIENNLSTSGDCITIDSDDVVLMCNQYSLTGSGSGSGIAVNSHDNVSIYGCIVSNFDTGISVTGPGSVLISDVNISTSNTGISFTSVTDSIVKYVNIDNCNSGIQLTSSDDNILYSNMLTNNDIGIALSESSDNNLEANVIKDGIGTGLLIDSSSSNNLVRNLYSCGAGTSDISDSGTGNRYKITACDTGMSCDYSCSVGCFNLYWPDTYPEEVSRTYEHGDHLIKIGEGFSEGPYTLCPNGYYPFDYPNEQVILGTMMATIDFMNSTFVGRPLLLGDVSYTDYNFVPSGEEPKVYPLIRDYADGLVYSNVFKNLRIENVSVGAYHTRGENMFDNVHMKNVDIGIYTFMPKINNSIFENCDEACIKTWDPAHDTTTVENTIIMNSGGHYGVYITGISSYSVVLKNNTICGSSNYDMFTTRTSGTVENNACDSSSPSGLCGATRTYYRDADGDGYGTESTTTTAACPPAGYTWRAGDCDDANADMHPGAEEICDGLDNDCNGYADDGLPTYTYYTDLDGDTFGDPSSPYDTCYSSPPSGYVSDNTDCDDSNPDINPGATEICDGVDQDCDSLYDEDFDADSDGYTTCGYSVSDGSFVGVDCDDSNADVHPGATEVCNEYDDNCDGNINEGFDSDGDTYTICGYSTLDGTFTGIDCDDTNADINPGATEVCNEYDDNCDGNINEGFDSDGDTYTICGYSTLDGLFTGVDCDDTNADIHPGATEVCDGIDQDCDSLYDEDFDADGDEYTTCGYNITTGEFIGVDCNDSNANMFPGNPEVCDGLDNDCNGDVDDGLPTYSYYADVDEDTYGDPHALLDTCYSTPPSGYVSDNTDCDDDTSDDPAGCPTDPSGCDSGCPGDGTSACAICINPGHTTECCGDGVDNNCDGLLDEEDPDCVPLGIDMMDMDGDGYNTYIDCDDMNPDVHPGAEEVCNGLDDNCNGRIDEGFDNDYDGYTICGYDVHTGEFIGKDCDDHNSNIHPGAHEILNKKDDDCDGWIDEGTGFDDSIRPVFPKIPMIIKRSPRFLPFIYLPMQ